jgi:glycosyltransferase involved in cell wall biosynthesis
MPFLSICIPTYNQPVAVDNLLSAIVEQWQVDIEVIVCDDSQAEATAVIVEKYSEIIPIRYLRRARGGLDKAIIDLVDAAAGDYVWWIGDDKILPDGIATVLEFLKKNDPDFLWVNSFDELNPVQQTFDLQGDVITYDPNELLSFDIGLLGFITATILKRRLAARHLNTAYLHLGSAWVCLYIVLCVVTSGGRLAILSTPCFSSLPKPSGEVRWYDQFQVFGVNLLHIVLNFSERFDKNKLISALNRNLERVLRSILVERALGYKTGFASSSVSVKPLFINYYKFPLFWLYLPLLVIPSAVLKVLYSLYKKMSRAE